MHIVVLAIVAIAALGGLLALLIGNRGWSWGTVVAGVLVMLAATGYLYLAVRLLERERAWREVVNRYESEVVRARDAIDSRGPGTEPKPIPNMTSVADLAETRSRWKRSLSRVETWRGRHWPGSAFVPPKEAAGTLVIAAEAAAPAGEPPAAGPPAGEPPAGEPPAPPQQPLNPGAEIAVFDSASVEDGGRFVGLFRVTAVAHDAAARRTVVSFVPIAEPDKNDLAVWAQPHDSIVVFENLPVDRWLGYYRTPQPPDPRLQSPTDPTKTDAETLKKLLAAVERRIAEFERHGEVVEEEAAALMARITGGEVPPGRYWAEVEFEADYELDDKLVERIKRLLQPEINGEDRVRRAFESGDTATFDLETAIGLGGKAKILRIVDRRPLVDGATTLLGGKLSSGDGEAALRTDGVTALRRVLEREIAGLERETERLEQAMNSIAAENDVLSNEATDLTADLELWQRDVAAATATVEAYTRRLRDVSQRLAADVRSIGSLGRAVNEAVGGLAAAIDRAAPPPDGAAQTPAPAVP